MYTYTTEKICPKTIDIEMEGNVVKYVSYEGGCNGNLKGLKSLATGMTYEYLKEKLDGTQCKEKGSSCPDQLIRAIEAAMAANEAKE